MKFVQKNKHVTYSKYYTVNSKTSIAMNLLQFFVICVGISMNINFRDNLINLCSSNILRYMFIPKTILKTFVDHKNKKQEGYQMPNFVWLLQ